MVELSVAVAPGVGHPLIDITRAPASSPIGEALEQARPVRRAGPGGR